jgi:hypothetical protein
VSTGGITCPLGPFGKYAKFIFFTCLLVKGKKNDLGNG